MNELLAFAALHLSIVRPMQREYYHRHAMQLQTHAINDLKDSGCLNINPENCVPTFLFSSILGTHMLCETLYFHRDDLSSFLAKFIQYASLHRGVRAIAVELYGYGGRVGAHNNTASLFSYAISNDGVLLAPALFAASIYMTLGRVIRAVRGERFSIISLNWLIKTFVLGDILSFVVQGSSIGLSVTGHATGATAVVLIGLFIQLISFGIFGLTAVMFYRRIMEAPTPQCHNADLPWKRTLEMLFGVSALIIVRSVYRVVEYSVGSNGYLLQHEWPMYVFDTIPMLTVMIIFYIWYPSRIQQPSSCEDQRK
ncbi:hypothetical protein KXW58_004896 [Aspergillus fumigatus]|nr:hypothetical protein KXW58_004896 [Aspergillus fumigatus]